MRCAGSAFFYVPRARALARVCVRRARARTRADAPTRRVLLDAWQAAELEAKVRLGMLSRKEQARLGPSLLAEAEAAAVARQQ